MPPLTLSSVTAVYDVFPDCVRTQPFGSGAGRYPYRDLMILAIRRRLSACMSQ